MANIISNPPFVNDVDVKGGIFSTPWTRWINSLVSFLKFPSLLAGSNAYTNEIDGVNINGTNNSGTIMVSDMGPPPSDAQILLHKHSTTVEPIIQGARSNTDTQAHAAVTAGMLLLTMKAAGSCGTNYKQFGSWSFAADTTGTLNNTSSPGMWVLKLTPDGAVTPATVITAKNDKSVVFAGTVKPAASGYLASDSSPGITTTITTALLVGKTITVKDGLITGFA